MTYKIKSRKKNKYSLVIEGNLRNREPDFMGVYFGNDAKARGVFTSTEKDFSKEKNKAVSELSKESGLKNVDVVSIRKVK